ncbi:MAG: hypothetical protein EXX96DRAFT_351559 [Benjaminiella poitrasii]|nr:MAG: hypothetical protein EXX96DRAFT_351559 [Benjaminiella poitrasii]
MSLFLAKKQEEINQKKVKDLLRLKENKKCFDCPTKSPTFVNTTIQTFICSRCSGLVREVGHRVKAISASKFSGAEALALKHGGNGIALKIWLSNYSTHSSPEPESDSDVRAFMRQKYYENKWLNRVLLQQHKEEVRTIISKNFTEDGLPIVAKSKGKIVSSGFVRVPLIADSEMNIMHDDMEEKVEIPEPALAQNDVNATSVYYPSNLPILPTSPTALDFSRTSIDSAHSSSSSSSYNTSSSSIYSAQSGSQNIQTTPHNRSNRSSMDRIQFPPTFMNTRTLSAEEIAARCRDSISCNSPPIQDSNNSLTSQGCVQLSPCHTEKPPMQRATPLLQIDVAQANRYLTREQHPFDQRIKSSVLTSHERNTNTHVPCNVFFSFSFSLHTKPN